MHADMTLVALTIARKELPRGMASVWYFEPIASIAAMDFLESRQLRYTRGLIRESAVPADGHITDYAELKHCYTAHMATPA